MEMIAHHTYTTVLNKEGWTLIIDFVESDRMTSRPDNFIDELELRKYHDAVHYINKQFGLPIKGDMIDVGESFCEIIDRWFDVPKKKVVLTVL